MITLILLFIFIVLCLVFSLCLHLAGGVLKLAFKLIVCIPCALFAALLGVVLCCTLILIPIGIGCFKLAVRMLNPLHLCFG